MLIGQELTFGPGWSLVEGDLYDITGRVREYDADARLVVNEDGELGLAHFDRGSSLAPGGALLVARTCVDWAAGSNPLPPLTGVPDARVLWDQRVSDSRRIVSMDAWNRRRRDAVARAQARRKLERAEWSQAMAEEYVFLASRKDAGRRPRIAVPRSVA